MTQQRFVLPRIISGGQTGADQGGLFAARECGFETGGWAPKNFLTEIGSRTELLRGFGLKDSGLDYVGRTRLNAREADVTIWFGNTCTPGFHATFAAVRAANKKIMEASIFSNETIASIIRSTSCVNIAGNRESKNSGIFEYTKSRLTTILEIVKETGEAR